MRKVRFLALALAVAVMLVGAGYAYWNETVTIDTNVTTGILDVDIVGATANTYYYQGTATTGTLDNVYARAAITTSHTAADPDDTDSITFDFTDLYPGSYGQAVVPIFNNGTMKVKVENPIVAFRDFDPAGDDREVDIVYTAITRDGVHTIPLTLIPDPLGQGNVKFAFPSGVTVYLEPDETATFTIKAELPKTVTGDENRSDLGLTFSPNFIQFNQ